jgi:hypothetical protein
MIAQMVVVIAGEQREDEATPQFAEVARDIVAELPDVISQHRRHQGALGYTQQTGRRDEWDADFSRSVKTGNDGDTLTAHRHQPVFRDLDEPKHFCGSTLVKRQ